PKRDAPTPDSRPDDDAPDDDAIASLVEETEPAVEEATPVVQIRPVVQTRKVNTVAAATADDVATARVAAAYAEPAAVDPVNTASVPSGWAVQVASSPKQSEAQALLDETSKQAPSILADATGFTVAFEKDGVTYY
ncbi:MAG: D-alanyl-D-alanine carboxypeptidase, partial [Mesorhizobium sp.]